MEILTPPSNITGLNNIVERHAQKTASSLKESRRNEWNLGLVCGTEKKLGRKLKPFHRLLNNSEQTNTLSAVNNFIPESRRDAALGSSVTTVLPGEDQFSRQ